MLSSEHMERSQNLLYLLWLIAKWGCFFKFTRPQVTSGIDRQMIKWAELDHPQSYGTKCTAGRNRPLSLSGKIWQHPHDCFGSDTVANFGCLPLRATVKTLPNFRSKRKWWVRHERDRTISVTFWNDYRWLPIQILILCFFKQSELHATGTCSKQQIAWPTFLHVCRAYPHRKTHARLFWILSWVRLEFLMGRLAQREYHLLLVSTFRLDNKSPLYYFSHCVLCDSEPLAIIRFEPIGQLLGSFARIAREAASGDVLPIDYSRVVNNVLPCCNRLFGFFGCPNSIWQ